MKNPSNDNPNDAQSQHPDATTAQPMPAGSGRPAAVGQSVGDLLCINIFNHEKDKWPSPRELTWPQLKAKYFNTHAPRKEKKGGMVFSPVSYGPQASRSNENVIAVYCAVFDIEHNGPFSEVRQKLNGQAFAAYSSFSHREAEPRYRLILPLAKPVSGTEWPLAWERLNAWLGGINDPSTKDACRIYYLPSRPIGSTEYFIEQGEGEPLDIEKLPPLNEVCVTEARTPASHKALKTARDKKSTEDFALGPADGLARVLTQCVFMQSASDPIRQADVGRPQWMAMVSNASMFETSEEWIHEASCHHDKYDEADTDKMIDSCRNFGAPITCGKIRESGFGGCPSEGCRTVSGKVTKAPAGLAAIPNANTDSTLAQAVDGISSRRGYYLENSPHYVSDDGVFIVKVREGEEFLERISSRIEVLAQTLDDAGNWGFLLSVTDPDGLSKEWAMPRELLASPTAWRSVLLSMGADIYQPTKDDPLYNYLMAAKAAARIRSVAKPGWTSDAEGNLIFVLPGRAIGHGSERVVFQSKDLEAHTTFGHSGDLDKWKREVAALCRGNSRLVIALCAALAGPLLHLLGEENGGFHLVGPSSIGKTTAVNIAASVWGRCDLFVKSWRTTDNALESTAVRHNDTLLILDELSQVNPMQAGDIAYMLGNGKGKGRSDKSGTARATASWRVLFLSTGERSLAEHMESGNRQALAGQEVRLINLTADASAEMGLFENIGSASTPQEFAGLIKKNTLLSYGVAGPAFIEGLIHCDSLNEVLAEARERMDSFVSRHIPANASGQVKRVARRMGLLAAAGELAVQLDVLPWEEGDATRGMQTCLQSWVDGLGSLGNQETDQAVNQVRRFIEQYGESRFSPWKEIGEMNLSSGRTVNRAGFRRETDDGRTEYYVLPEVYKTEICHGLRSTEVTKALRDRNLLMLSPDGKNQRSERLPDLGPMKVYRIKPEILGDGDETVS